jgi:hypothetical protein
MIMDEEVKQGFVESLGSDYKNLSENELHALLSETLSEMTEPQAEDFWNTMKILGRKILSALPNIVQGAAVGGLPGAAVAAVAGLSGTQQKQPTGAAAPTTPAAAPTTPAAAPTTPAAAPTTDPTTPAAEAYSATVRDHRRPSAAPPSQTSPPGPGFIWVDYPVGHWERARASGQPSYPPGQPSYPPGQPSYPPGQPSYPPGQPSYPPGQPSYPYPYPPGQPSYPYPYPPGQPSYPYPYPPGQPSYPPDYDYSQQPYVEPGMIPYTETSTPTTAPTTGTPTTVSNARAAALDILEIIKNPKFLQVLTATILGPKGKKEIEIAGKYLPSGTIFNLLRNLSSTASTGTASTAPSNLETYIESKPGIDSGNEYEVDNAIMDLIREDNISARQARTPNSNNIESSYSLPEDGYVIELD